MPHLRCPGQDQRNWKPEDIFLMACPWCAAEIEFWKDEPAHTCRGCGHSVRNPRLDLGCAKWCKSAKECLGALAQKDSEDGSLRDRLIVEMKTALGDDRRRIERALNTLDRAEEILAIEGGNAPVVKSAAVLLELDEPEGCRAGRILERQRAETGLAEAIRDTLAACRNNAPETPEASIVSDAARLARLMEGSETLEADGAAWARQAFHTGAGRALAEREIRCNHLIDKENS